MNPEFPPVGLPVPEIKTLQKPRRVVPPDPEVVAQRAQIADRWCERIATLSAEFRGLSETQRKAVFFRLEHDGSLDIVGTDLKAVVESVGNITLVVPKPGVEDLSRFEAKVRDFGEGGLDDRGKPKNYSLVEPLQSIERGDPKDRLSQTLFDNYDELVGEKYVICEIEIVDPFTRGRHRIRESLLGIRREIEAAFRGGTRGNMFEHEEMHGSCRAVIRCTGEMFQELVEGDVWQTKIFWFDAKPKFETFSTIIKEFDVSKLAPIDAPDESAPTVCIIDTGVTVGNPFMRPVSRQDQFRSFLESKPDNPFDEYGHGTGVGSLAAYHGLNITEGGHNVGKVWIVSARVLDENNQAEEEKLFSKVLEQVVKHYVPLGIRIFNLSVSIVNRHWNEEAKRTVPRKSWVARKIDQLSREHDVVFVTCTGNILTGDIQDAISDGQPYPMYFRNEDTSIYDPGHAALSLSVGAIAPPRPRVVGRAAALSAVADSHQPAPFTRTGPGMAREVKPELVEYGGNLVVDSSTDRMRTNPGTDILMANHLLTPALTHSQGTSFAAPRVTHKLALVLRDLQDLGIEPSASLLKAALVNSATQPDAVLDCQSSLTTEMETVPARDLYRNLVGYGFPDESRATNCDDYSILLHYQGEIEPDKVAFFDIPIPASLSDTGSTTTKRITITTAHAPEVQRWGLDSYLGSFLKWKLFRGDVSRDDVVEQMAKEDAESPDAFGVTASESEESAPLKEMSGEFKFNVRSRGCIQHDIFEWQTHRDEFSDNHYTLAVGAYSNSRWGGRIQEPIPFAVVVRIEDELRSALIYTEIRQTVETQIRQQAETEARV